jgi:hypothetical protein
MKQFLTRVELHGAGKDDYLTLHGEMERLKFRRTIRAVNGLDYQLPTTEYSSFGNITAAEVASVAKQAANQTGKSSSVISVEYAEAVFYLDVATSNFPSLLGLLRP